MPFSHWCCLESSPSTGYSIFGTIFHLLFWLVSVGTAIHLIVRTTMTTPDVGVTRHNQRHESIFTDACDLAFLPVFTWFDAPKHQRTALKFPFTFRRPCPSTTCLLLRCMPYFRTLEGDFFETIPSDLFEGMTSLQFLWVSGCNYPGVVCKKNEEMLVWRAT